jgi:hypothetical protein
MKTTIEKAVSPVALRDDELEAVSGGTLFPLFPAWMSSSATSASSLASTIATATGPNVAVNLGGNQQALQSQSVTNTVSQSTTTTAS